MNEQEEYELRMKIRLGLNRVSEKLIDRVKHEGVELVCGDSQGNIVRVRASNLTQILTSRIQV